MNRTGNRTLFPTHKRKAAERKQRKQHEARVKRQHRKNSK